MQRLFINTPKNNGGSTGKKLLNLPTSGCVSSFDSDVC